MDIRVKPDEDNAKAVYAALSHFGAPLNGVSSTDFVAAGPFFRMGREPIAVDILTEIPGVDFDAAWARRIEEVVDLETGLKANFISRDDLVVAKLAAGRPQDIADVAAIRKAIKSNPR